MLPVGCGKSGCITLTPFAFESKRSLVIAPGVSIANQLLEDFEPLKTEHGLFENYQLDDSRTCIFWSDRIDLPSDTLLEYGKKVVK